MLLFIQKLSLVSTCLNVTESKFEYFSMEGDSDHRRSIANKEPSQRSITEFLSKAIC